MDEAALLKTVLSGDLDAILVYADWLEEQNHLSRANFMRMQHRLLARIAPPSKPLPRSRTRKALSAQERALVESASELFAAGKRLPQNFVAKVALPPLLTTYWDGADSDAARRQLHFCEDGVLDWASPTGRYVDGTWVQIGNALRMTINNEYVTLEGVIVGDQIFGTALNVNDFAWTWRVVRSTASSLEKRPITRRTATAKKTAAAKKKKKKKALAAAKKSAATKRSRLKKVSSVKKATRTTKKPTVKTRTRTRTQR